MNLLVKSAGKMNKIQKWMAGPQPVDILDSPDKYPWRMVEYKGKWTLIIRVAKIRCRRSTGYDATPANRHLAERRALTIFRQTINDSKENESGELVDLRRNPRSEIVGWIYFIQQINGGPIKIGWATNVERRCVVMQAVNPYQLSVLGKFKGTIDDERRLHDEFAAVRLHGEWFEPTPELLERLGDLQP